METETYPWPIPCQRRRHGPGILPVCQAGILLAASLAASRESGAQDPCPPAAGTAVESGWQAYRSDSLEAAAKRFGQAEQLCPGNLNAMVGLGFTLLRQDRLDAADSLFRRVLARDSANADGWEGRARASYRKGDMADAGLAGRRALALNPRNGDLRALLDRISPEWDRPVSRPGKRPAALQLVARVRGKAFEVAGPRGWQPLYLQGVNLGVPLPGKYPSEFRSTPTGRPWGSTAAAGCVGLAQRDRSLDPDPPI